MKNTILSLVAAGILAGSAHANPFVATSGVTSVSLDTATLASAASLNLTGANGTATAAPSYAVGFAITPDTTFQFSYNDNTFAPVGGFIGHSGSVTFNELIELGNFRIGYATDRPVAASGFYVQDTISLGAILFDIGPPGAATFSNGNLFIGPADLMVSPELSAFLLANEFSAGVLTGAVVGSAQISAAAIPEPSTYAAILGAAALGFVAMRRRRMATSA